MKKVLFATTVLASLATIASAETGVKISGYGRFGVIHLSDRAPGLNETTVHTRLRFNIDAKTETDSGVVFGGRIRLQDQSRGTHGSSTAGGVLNAALLYAEYEGFRVEVGNTNTVGESAKLIAASEMGLTDKSFGDIQSRYFAYNQNSYAALGLNPNYMGVFASYKLNEFSAMASFITPDQTGASAVDEEMGLNLAYTTDLFSVSAALVQNGAGVTDNDIWFIGGNYKINPDLQVGLNYIDEGIDRAGVSMGKTATLYGNYKFGATTVKAYVANNDYIGNKTDTSFGLGADYDLGGAKVQGSIQRGYQEETWVDLGVRFMF